MQTSVSASGQSIGVAGQEWDNSDKDIVSGFSEEASAEIPFGCGVVAGTAEQGVKLPSSSGDTPVGVSVFGFNHMPPGTVGDLGTTGLKPKAGLRVMRKGRILARLDKAVTSIAPHSDRGWLRYTADGVTNPQVGAWGKTTDSGKNLDCTKATVFRSAMFTTSAGDKVAVLEVDFTNKL